MPQSLLRLTLIQLNLDVSSALYRMAFLRAPSLSKV